jgi:large subunit ribosomal protein L4
MAIAARLRDEEVVLVDELSMKEPATREMAAILKALGLQGTRTLVATESYDRNVYRSARNLAQVSVAPVSELNALLVLRPRRILLTRAGLDAIREQATGSQESHPG